jgi:hypothetical protein
LPDNRRDVMTEPVDGGTMPPPENPEEQTPAINPFSALVGVVMAPGETFEALEKKPIWMVPLVLFVVLSIVTTVLFMPKVDFETAIRDQLARQGQEVDEAQVETFVKIQKPIIYTTAAIGTPIVLLIVTLVYMLGFKAFGGVGSFGQYFCITIFSWVPQVLKSIIGSIVAFTRESIRIEEAQTLVMSNLGFLADPVDKPAMFALLSSFDLFTIWSLVLMVMGYGVISKRPKSQSIGVVVAIWLVYVIGKTGFALLGQMMRSGTGA